MVEGEIVLWTSLLQAEISVDRAGAFKKKGRDRDVLSIHNR
jgi:hypothetical protein